MPATVVALLAAVAMAFAIVSPVAADATLTTELTGAAEVCDPANTCNDPEGSGTATVDITTHTGEICVTLTWEISVGTASAAHVHEALEGEAGPVVLPLFTEPDGDGMFEGCFTDAALAAELEAEPANYYVNVQSETYPNGAVRGQLAAEGGGEPLTTTVMVMKHNCLDVTTEPEFLEVEARAASNPTTPDAAFGATVETVLECPTVVLPGETQTTGSVAGGASTFDFLVSGRDLDIGTAVELADSTYMMSSACETDVEYDANANGTLDADICLDLSHHVFEVVAPTVIVTETAVPSGFAFGAVRFTPGSGDDATLVSAADGVIELDAAADDDGMVMLHVYNFAQAAAAPDVTPTPAPMATQLPNTSAESDEAVSGSLAVTVALVAVATIGMATFRMVARCPATDGPRLGSDQKDER
jgi:hypothetical protein